MKSEKNIFNKLKREIIHVIKTKNNSFKIYNNKNKIMKSNENLLT